MTLRNAFGDIALDATLAAVRDRVIEVRDKLPTLTAAGRLPVDTTSTVQRAAEQAKVYFAGSGRITLGVAGNLRATVHNPSDQTTNVHLLRLAGLGSSVTWGSLRLNPTTGLPASAARPNNNVILGYPGDATQFKVDTDTNTALSGGTDMGITIGIPNSSRFQVDFNVPLVIGPGATLGVALPFSGPADAAFSLYWFRTPA